MFQNGNATKQTDQIKIIISSHKFRLSLKMLPLLVRFIICHLLQIVQHHLSTTISPYSCFQTVAAKEKSCSTIKRSVLQFIPPGPSIVTSQVCHALHLSTEQRLQRLINTIHSCQHTLFRTYKLLQFCRTFHLWLQKVLASRKQQDRSRNKYFIH